MQAGQSPRQHVTLLAHCMFILETKWTIKDRSRSVVTILSFKSIPARIVIKLIHYCVFWLNSFPAKNGISADVVLCPRAIVVGATVDCYNNHCKIEFGTYVQTHEQHDNTMIPRTIAGVIALRPSGNSQGGQDYFFSLTTGKLLLRNRWTVLPMPADVKERLHKCLVDPWTCPLWNSPIGQECQLKTTMTLANTTMRITNGTTMMTIQISIQTSNLSTTRSHQEWI